MVDTVRTSSNSTGLAIPLFLVFLVLKLTDVIDWSWWWVTAPLWIPFLVVLAITLIVGFGMSVVSLARRRK